MANPVLLLVHSFNIKGINGLILQVLSRVMDRAGRGQRESERSWERVFRKETVLGAPRSACATKGLGVKEEKPVAASGGPVTCLPCSWSLRDSGV